MSRPLFSIVSLLVAISSPFAVDAYPTYQTRIPNGNRVPNPCNPSAIWDGVGHRNSGGGGTLNPFGVDFKANNFVWDRMICMKDSDGDGYTNGQELGDPNCTWAQGNTPTTMAMSHPGICDPIGSSKCAAQNAWMSNCTSGKFNCPAVNNPGVKNLTLRFPPTPVPTTVTTYICHRYDLPNTTISDIIATEPIIDNKEIIHHMLLYACTEPPTEPEGEAFLCGMGNARTCMSLIGLWGVGATGQCLNKDMGFRIGQGGFKYAVLQIHWNNHQQLPNLTDSSGMRIYYTDQLRPHRGEVMTVGQTYLEIPPGLEDVSFYGQCSGGCTAQWPQSIFLTSVALHMHKIGRAGNVMLYRGDKLLEVLDDNDDYDYNSPRLIEFDNPIELAPGDRISMKCVFDSQDRTATTTYGEATSDEMCFAFLAYYPQMPGLGYCGQWKSVELCGNGRLAMRHQSCDFITFLKLVGAVSDLCSANCSDPACVHTLKGVFGTGCAKNADVRGFLAAFVPSQGSVLAYCSLAMQSMASQPMGGPDPAGPTTPATNHSPDQRSTPLLSGLFLLSIAALSGAHI